ncbi:MAG: hypothetical protein ACJ79K_13500 [Gemmatimonadaceae bacterium]
MKRYGRCVALLFAVGGTLAGCRHRPSDAAPEAGLVAENPCWWTVFRSPLPLDTVAHNLVAAFRTLGLTDPALTQQGDTILAHAGPTRLDDRFGATYSARMVAFRRGDTTLYRYFVTASPPSGGWPPAYDTVTMDGRGVSVNPAASQIGLCQAIASTAQNHGTAPPAPNGEESLTVWRRR